MIPCLHPFCLQTPRKPFSSRRRNFYKKVIASFFRIIHFPKLRFCMNCFFHKNCRNRRFSSAVFTAYIATVLQCKLFAQTFLDFAVQPFIRRNGCFPNEILICTQKSRGKQIFCFPRLTLPAFRQAEADKVCLRKNFSSFIHSYIKFYTTIKRIIVFLFCREGYVRTH